MSMQRDITYVSLNRSVYAAIFLVRKIAKIAFGKYVFINRIHLPLYYLLLCICEKNLP
jgi:hypothetical protein